MYNQNFFTEELDTYILHMKKIDELIENNDSYHQMLVQKCFDSKKNTVCYVLLEGNPRVIKWFPPGLKSNMETEYTILKKGTKKLNIPTVFKKDEKNTVLIQSYIPGVNLCDQINTMQVTFEEKQKNMIMLANWFVKFHELFKGPDGFWIRGDAILRNFIVKDDVWGIDFEEARPGKPVEDIARMTASILTTTPMFTDEKFKLSKVFIETYKRHASWTIDKLDEEIAYAFLEISQWRPDEENILRKYAQRIKTKGLE